VVRADLVAVDCGTPADYLRANMLASGGAPVVEPGAEVRGELVRSVVWAGERVGAGERLVDAVRAAGVTLHPFATGPGG
jgi:NDP-sugar pyrophosphorylase family protein